MQPPNRAVMIVQAPSAIWASLTLYLSPATSADSTLFIVPIKLKIITGITTVKYGATYSRPSIMAGIVRKGFGKVSPTPEKSGLTCPNSIA
jgi:hypothetical protein